MLEPDKVTDTDLSFFRSPNSINMCDTSFYHRTKHDATEMDIHRPTLYLMRVKEGPGSVRLWLSRRHTPHFTRGAQNLFMCDGGSARGRCKPDRLRKYGRYLSELDPRRLGPVHTDDGFLYETMACFWGASTCTALEARAFKTGTKNNFWDQYIQRRRDVSDDPTTQCIQDADSIVRITSDGTPYLLSPLNGRKFIASVFAQLVSPTRTFQYLKNDVRGGFCFIVHRFSQSFIEEAWQDYSNMFTDVSSPFSLEAVLCIMLTHAAGDYPWNQ
jgi:hypothetical protein